MVIKPRAQQKPKMLRASIGRASKDNRENQAPGTRRSAGTRKSLARQVLHPVMDPEPCIVLSTPSPSGSPGELSPGFTALDSSLAEINGDGMPMTAEDLLLENVKRQTLSVCRGMSPLLQAKPFALPKPALFKMPVEEKPEDQSSFLMMSDFEDLSIGPKRLSIEATTTVTKNKAPDAEVSSKRVSLRKMLFSTAAGEDADNSPRSSSSSQEFEDSLNEPNICVFTRHDNITVGPTVEKPEEEPSLSVDIQSEQCLDSFADGCQSEPKVVDVEEPFLLNGETPLSVEELSSEPTLPLEELEVTTLTIEEPPLSTDKPIMKEDLVFIGDNSTQLDEDAFKVHTSIVTSRLLGRKRLSDPTDEAPRQVKKLRPQEVKKAEVKKQPPRERPMNRTLALRKAAASKKTGAPSATGNSKAQKKVGGQYKPKGPMKGVPMAKLNLLNSNRTG